METTLAADARTPGKKGDARKLRKTGKIPAVVYGPETEPVHVSVDPDQLTRLFRATGDRNTVVDLKIDGKKGIPTLVRQIERHPVTRAVVHADFYHVAKKRKVEVMVPVVGVGRPAGAILGGRMRVIRRVLKARCDYDQIPKELAVDVSPMNIGDMVLASEIPLPKGVELIYDNDFNVIVVYGKRVKVDAVIQAEEDAAAAAAAAAPAAE